jgi:hypothetical protein
MVWMFRGTIVDTELAALISAAATTLVQLLATDSWERAKSAVGSLWQRVHPDHAEVVQAELADSRDAVLAARSAGDEQAERDVEIEWRGRLRHLAATDPSIASDLADLLESLRAALSASEQGPTGHIEMRARASGHGQVYQAGRDQHITRP